MTSPERGFALYQAVNAVLDNNISGSFVECGVWRGGSAMIMVQTLIKRNAHRQIILFDTFEGMTEPGEVDKDVHGNSAADLMAGSDGPRIAELVKASASLKEVRVALAKTGFNMDMVRFVKGDVRKILDKTSTQQIAILRLDTDFYDSTLAELRSLWPRLANKGLFIVDDYGHWRGARHAFNDYFEDKSHGYDAPLLWRIDYTGYGGVKLQDRVNADIARYDYMPPGFDPVDLLHCFPYAAVDDPKLVKWPYMRAQVPHIWRTDLRDKRAGKTGYASTEEAVCLYALARQFRGSRGLEIGTHFGWTAAHLVAAGLRLDCIDPEFNFGNRIADVSASLDRVDGPGTYQLFRGFSPDLVDEARRSADEPYSFVFIDGNHEGDAPRNDALAVLPHLAKDAIVVFHDLTSPFVERGLYALRMAGFDTCIYETMQILGIAKRGNVELPKHLRDPNTPSYLPMHLHKYSRSS